jgi:hypothetical protein
MPHDLHTEIEIDAPAQTVWDVLVDFPSYGSWNPFVTHIEGTLAPKARLRVKLKPPGGPAMKIRPQLVEVEPGKRFEWVGHLGIRGLFDGAHRFEVIPLSAERTRLVQAEHFNGILVPLVRKLLDGKTRQGFEAMNEAVKRRAETRTR